MNDADDGTPSSGASADSAKGVAASDPIRVADIARWVLRFVGIVGGGGGGAALLALGVGYVAVKNFDAMLGIPASAVTQAAYVRTGALFFPRSIQYMVTYVSQSFLVIGIAAAVALLLVAVSAWKLDWITERFKKPAWKVGALALSYAVLLAVAVIYLRARPTLWKTACQLSGVAT